MTEHKDRIEHTLEVLVLRADRRRPVPQGHGPDVREHVRGARSGRGRSPPGAGAAAHDDREEHRSGRDDVRRADGAPARRARGRQRAPARADVPRLDRRRPTHRNRQPAPTTGAQARTPSRPTAAPTPPPARVGRRGAQGRRRATASQTQRLERLGRRRLVADPRLRRAVGVAGRRAARRPLADELDAVRVVRRRAPQAAHDSRQDRTDLRVGDRGRRAVATRDVPRSSSSRATARRAAQSAAALWATREARPEPLDDAASILDRDDAAMSSARSTSTSSATASSRSSAPRRHRLGVIDEIFVEPRPGRSGWGAARRAARRVLRRRRMLGRRRDRAARHRQAKNFFERAGFTARCS